VLGRDTPRISALNGHARMHTISNVRQLECTGQRCLLSIPPSVGPGADPRVPFVSACLSSCSTRTVRSDRTSSKRDQPSSCAHQQTSAIRPTEPQTDAHHMSDATAAPTEAAPTEAPAPVALSVESPAAASAAAGAEAKAATEALSPTSAAEATDATPLSPDAKDKLSRVSVQRLNRRSQRI
jgi:hypothetical protein